jgi:hypothetical protein
MRLDGRRSSPVSVAKWHLLPDEPSVGQHVVAGALSDMVGTGACIALHHPTRGAAMDLQVLEQVRLDLRLQRVLFLSVVSTLQ